MGRRSVFNTLLRPELAPIAQGLELCLSGWHYDMNMNSDEFVLFDHKYQKMLTFRPRQPYERPTSEVNCRRRLT